jgi:hypothetical protein
MGELGLAFIGLAIGLGQGERNGSKGRDLELWFPGRSNRGSKASLACLRLAARSRGNYRLHSADADYPSSTSNASTFQVLCQIPGTVPTA